MLHIPNNVSKLEGSTSLVMMAAIFELPGSFAVIASLKQLQAHVHMSLLHFVRLNLSSESGIHVCLSSRRRMSASERTHHQSL